MSLRASDEIEISSEAMYAELKISAIDNGVEIACRLIMELDY